MTLAFLPAIFRQPAPVPAIKALFCDGLSNARPIPDNDAGGVLDAITISDPRLIADLDVSLEIDHSWVGDLNIRLTHQESGRSISLVDRPGIPSSDQGCSSDDVRTILDDEISLGVENKCASGPAAISGIYQPQESLASYDGVGIAGTWTLQVSDHSNLDTGSLRAWCLVASISPVPEPPTPSPPPPSLPDQRIISGVTGKDQALPLDCESRSAVDWAKFFSVSIGELDFYNHLPHSDNPDKGFVGNVNGIWGRIPPNAYGVHAQPVADLLQAYGVQAYAHRPLSWDHLRAEIAAGRPVFVWIVGSVVNGIPVYYTPSDGLHTVVAAYEHTVIVTGYTPTRVYFLNGDTIDSTSVVQFLDSWSALGNMAITAGP